MNVEVLSDAERGFLAAARRAVLATTTANGKARLVPICFVVVDAAREALAVIYSPLDEKPKAAADPRALARVRDLLARPDVTLLVDRWDEDWTRLAWLRCDGRAELVEPDGPGASEHAGAVDALRAKYPQYRDHALEARLIIRIVVERALTWGDLAGDD